MTGARAGARPRCPRNSRRTASSSAGGPRDRGKGRAAPISTASVIGGRKSGGGGSWKRRIAASASVVEQPLVGAPAIGARDEVVAQILQQQQARRRVLGQDLRAHGGPGRAASRSMRTKASTRAAVRVHQDRRAILQPQALVAAGGPVGGERPAQRPGPSRRGRRKARTASDAPVTARPRASRRSQPGGRDQLDLAGALGRRGRGRAGGA